MMREPLRLALFDGAASRAFVQRLHLVVEGNTVVTESGPALAFAPRVPLGLDAHSLDDDHSCPLQDVSERSASQGRRILLVQEAHVEAGANVSIRDGDRGHVQGMLQPGQVGSVGQHAHGGGIANRDNVLAHVQTLKGILRPCGEEVRFRPVYEVDVSSKPIGMQRAAPKMPVRFEGAVRVLLSSLMVVAVVVGHHQGVSKVNFVQVVSPPVEKRIVVFLPWRILPSNSFVGVKGRLGAESRNAFRERRRA
mmetsp:Transcript_3605/g.14185  ORF Transcript_3605/g.14185 Transcript_3605/m.14185 type:complete len:251 (+) Transcript_3605:1401-2153(+)